MKKILVLIIAIAILLVLIILEKNYISQESNRHIIDPKNYNNISTIPNKNIDKVRVNQGKNIASRSSIVICGLARNIVPKLIKNIPRLEYIGKHFRNYKIIIFENDSTDGTRELIKKWKQMNNNIILLECCNDKICNCNYNQRRLLDYGNWSNTRTNKMAYYRNNYLDFVKQNFSNFDYMLVSDLDLEGAYSLDGLFHSLSFPEYSVIFSNGLTNITSVLGNEIIIAYDPFAYVAKDTKRDNYNRILDTYNLYRMNYEINNSSNLIPVESAFNGMALYKIDKILNSYYTGEETCEHIGFHQTIPGKKAINKEWIGYAGVQGI